MQLQQNAGYSERKFERYPELRHIQRPHGTNTLGAAPRYGWAEGQIGRFTGKRLTGRFYHSKDVHHPYSLGVDVASGGGDETVWVVLGRYGVREIVAKRTPDTSEIVGVTMRLTRKYHIWPGARLGSGARVRRCHSHQGRAYLVALGCGDRHDLSLSPAPCSALRAPRFRPYRLFGVATRQNSGFHRLKGKSTRVDRMAATAVQFLVDWLYSSQELGADQEGAMVLPHTNRVIFDRNPLAEVTAQLTFPPILRIEAEAPVQFQEGVRDRYPLYRRIMAASQLPADLPASVRSLIQGIGAAAGPIQHLFETQDRKSVVTLSRELLSFKTTNYTRWEVFRDRLESLRCTLEEIYRPASYGRLGLRYVDVIRRSILGLEKVPWSELLNPPIGGELTAPELGDYIESVSSQLHCKLEGDDCFLTLRKGIALAEPTKEKCFLLDCDFHTHQPTELANVMATLNVFNRASGNLFRWAIRDRLRDALQPKLLD